MGLMARIARLVHRFRVADRRRTESDVRRCRFETMEGRRLLSADPIRMGAVYVEEDSGSDAHGDTFEITFVGGAPNTELTRVVIDGDQGQPGFGETDVIFDTVTGGIGADQGFPFQVISLQTQDPTATVRATVEDGSSQLILDFTGFRAGDKLVFSIDVDEVEDFDSQETDLNIINDGIDPITSGVEFQSSRLTSYFAASHYHDANGTTAFRNRYDDLLIGTQLNLPEDNAGGKRDRSDGAVMQVAQTPLPVSISGKVFLERNLDLTQDSNEPGLAGVQLSLWRKDGSDYVATGHSTTTDANGRYEFGTALNLLPGTYQVREAQPTGLFSVGAVPGTVDGSTSGQAVAGDRDVLTEITIPLGDQHSINNNFAEAEPARLSGYVYHDRSNDGARGSGEEGLASVTLQIIPVSTISAQSTVTVTTNPQGFFEALGLAPGTYRVVESVQPAGYFDGLDRPGTVNGTAVGTVSNPGDSLESIVLGGGAAGIEYNFGELAPASIGGRVYLTDKDGNCFEDGAVPRPIADVVVRLYDSQGQQIAETKTNSLGEYKFTNLLPGTYRVVEVTPTGLIDGDEHAGTVGNNPRGQVSGDDTVSGITLGSGEQGIEYNFCEHEPSSISGFVYHDANENGQLDGSEQRIAGVQVELRDGNNQIVGTTVTDGSGYYEFLQLSGGTYRIIEKHPAGWLDGLDTAGTVDGIAVGTAGNDQITAVAIGWGQAGRQYNFGELLPGSISGQVHADKDGDCELDSDEQAIAGVTIQLLDANGQVIATTLTNQEGRYTFDNLTPGAYGIRELQPDGYFHGAQHAGSHGGNASQQDLVTSIRVGSGQILTDYDFCEIPPSSLTGLVFSDPNQDCQFNSGDSPLGNVTVQLLNANGVVVATTVTDANGRYKFENLAPGSYSVRELQPAGYFQGGQSPGSGGGVASAQDLISQVQIGAGQNLVDYNFCEVPPSSLAGMVFSDPNLDCEFNPGDSPLPGVTVQLLDGQGAIVATTLTDTNGRYEFSNLAPGMYSVRELQPDGYFQGGQSLGSGGGVVGGQDLITQVAIGAGVALVDYNFCEVPPSSLAGRVFADPNRDCLYNAGDSPLANVTVQLVDSQGNAVATQQTDSEGHYRFDNLAPGTYSLREVQPTAYFQGGQRAGSGGGNVLTTDQIAEINILGGQSLVDYDFCEQPPAAITGFVYQDGPTIQTADGNAPANLGDLRDGSRTPDDQPIGGVLLQLRDGFTGDPIDGSEALSGTYGSGPIQVRTDANGYFEFRNLPGGRSYAIFQVHPDGYIDSIDTVGTTTGFAFNPQVSQQTQGIEPLAGQPASDAIIRIAVNPGQTSNNNNFSEIRVERSVVPPPPPDPPRFPPNLPPVYTPPEVPAIPSLPGRNDPAPNYLAWSSPRIPVYFQASAGGLGYTWHLSVINGGMPRDLESGESEGDSVWRSANYLDTTMWKADHTRQGRWLVGILPQGSATPETQSVVFGIRGSIPIAGDFNGDGTSEMGLFYRGEWFIDLNGNGQWDEEDLWAKLGDDLDRPVVGDWDGDGKDDIGIYGPEWFGDQRQIDREPGLPDSHNEPAKANAHTNSDAIARTENPKNVPPSTDEATHGERLLRLSRTGPRRSDVIDHVFRYGQERDFPLAGDWNGDGIRTIGIFRDGTWRVDSDGDGLTGPHDRAWTFGAPGDVPVVGDWNGDGIEEIGIYRGGKWILDVNGNRELDAHDKVFQLGTSEDYPVVGDWNGDGIDDPAVYRESAPPIPQTEVRVER